MNFVFGRAILILCMVGFCLGCGVSSKDAPSLEATQAGLASLSKHDYQLAVDQFTRALAFKPPQDVERLLLFYRALAFAGLNEEANTKQDLDSLLRQSRADSLAVKALVCRAMIYARNCDSDAAMSDGDQAVKINPQNPEACRLRGCLRLRFRGDFQGMLADYEKALTLAAASAGQVSTNQLSLAYDERAERWYSLGCHDRAEADFRMALRYGPSPAAHLGLTSLLITARDYRAAMQEIRNAVDAGAEQERINEQLGALEFCRGDVKAARQHFENAKKQRLLAMLEYATGNHSSAIHTLTQLADKGKCDYETLETLGLVSYVEGDLHGAEIHLQKAFEVQQIPTVGWGILCQIWQSQTNASAAQELKRRINGFPRTIWIASVLRLAIEKRLTEEGIRTLAEEVGGVGSQQFGEALYLVAESERNQGQIGNSIHYFQRVHDSTSPWSLVNMAVQRRLKQSGAEEKRNAMQN